MKRMLIGLGVNKPDEVELKNDEVKERHGRPKLPSCPLENTRLVNEFIKSDSSVNTTTSSDPCMEPCNTCETYDYTVTNINSHTPSTNGYESLKKILTLAYEQAANGKGKERHGVKGEDWTEQPIIRHQRAYGVGFALGQAAKKMEEAMSLPSDRARFELLGAIVYVAAAYRFLEEAEEE